MLSYRHLFHAGNFADVHKHIVLCAAFAALARKDKPLVVVDTHAGAGLYDLRSGPAQMHCEYTDGIARLWQRDDAPPAVARYVELVRDANGGGRLAALRRYPGSPWLVRALMRSHDRLLAVERHSSDAPLLRRLMGRDPRVRVETGDGYETIKAALPPVERRGLVLVDPSYELADEPERVERALRDAHRRFPTGVYLVWYPLTARVPTSAWLARLGASGVRRQLCVELSVMPADHPLGLSGSGMLIVNPPWQLDDELAQTMPWLAEALSRHEPARWRVEWLVGE